MDAQEEHDHEMSKRRMTLEAGSRQRLEALLAKKNAASSAKVKFPTMGPIERAMRDHPGLTREKAIEMAEAFGF